MHVTSDQFSDKFESGWKKNQKVFYVFFPNYVMHVTNGQFLDKFNNGWKNIQNGRFIAIYGEASRNQQGPVNHMRYWPWGANEKYQVSRFI